MKAMFTSGSPCDAAYFEREREREEWIEKEASNPTTKRQRSLWNIERMASNRDKVEMARAMGNKRTITGVVGVYDDSGETFTPDFDQIESNWIHCGYGFVDWEGKRVRITLELLEDEKK